MGSVRWPPNSFPKLQSSSSSHIWRFDDQFNYSPNKWTKTFLAALFSLMLVLPLLSCRLFVCDCPCLGQPETLLSFPQPSECNQVAASVPPLWACVPSASITPPPFRERTHFVEASMHALPSSQTGARQCCIISLYVSMEIYVGRPSQKL